MDFTLYKKHGNLNNNEFDSAVPIAKSEPIVRVFDKRLPGEPIDRDIDSKFHASSDFAKYNLSDYTVGFVEVKIPG